MNLIILFCQSLWSIEWTLVIKLSIFKHNTVIHNAQEEIL